MKLYNEIVFSSEEKTDKAEFSVIPYSDGME